MVSRIWPPYLRQFRESDPRNLRSSWNITFVLTLLPNIFGDEKTFDSTFLWTEHVYRWNVFKHVCGFSRTIVKFDGILEFWRARFEDFPGYDHIWDSFKNLTSIFETVSRIRPSYFVNFLKYHHCPNFFMYRTCFWMTKKHCWLNVFVGRVFV